MEKIPVAFVACGINLYGAGSTYNLTSHESLAKKIAQLVNLVKNNTGAWLRADLAAILIFHGKAGSRENKID